MYESILGFVFSFDVLIIIALILSSCWKWTQKWSWFIGIPSAIGGALFPLGSYMIQGNTPLPIFFAGASTFFFWMFFASLHAALGTDCMTLPDYVEYQKWRVFGDEKPERKKAIRFGYLSMTFMLLTIVSWLLE